MERYEISSKVSSAAHKTSTLYHQNLKYTKNSIFARNIQPTKILLLHIFNQPNFAFSKKT